jgi:hypothetical protein
VADAEIRQLKAELKMLRAVSWYFLVNLSESPILFLVLQLVLRTGIF